MCEGDDKIPTFPNEVNPNPVTALDMQTKDGAILRFKLPEVLQSRFMWAVGKMLASLDVPLDIELPPSLGHLDQEWLTEIISNFMDEQSEQPGDNIDRERQWSSDDLAAYIIRKKNERDD